MAPRHHAPTSGQIPRCRSTLVSHRGARVQHSEIDVLDPRENLEATRWEHATSAPSGFTLHCNRDLKTVALFERDGRGHRL